MASSSSYIMSFWKINMLLLFRPFASEVLDLCNSLTLVAVPFLQVPIEVQDSHETTSAPADQEALFQTASKDETNNLNAFIKQTNNSSGQFSLLSAFGGQSKEINSSAGQFSLLSEFGQSKETESNVPEETETLSDAFALKLKEKAANEASAKGLIEPFFFGQNDGRFVEADQFLQLKKSLSEVRSEYEEKRPVLASIMKKKLKNKAKRQEKMSFGVKKGKRKFNPKFKKRPNMK